MKFRVPVNWCVRRFLKAHPWLLYCDSVHYRILSSRNLFSLTKTWPKKYTLNVRTELESYWHPKILEENKTRKQFDMKSDKEKFYALCMFPYPSGKLHMGHVRVYTLSDCMARYQRLKGKQVIHPMGWDAFGLPAENAAIERGEMPDKWTFSNIENMRKQLEELQCSFDWEREISTCHPSYYKWSQFIFLKMHEAGLVYQKEGLVNWDPVDQTVLADEQIDENGNSWRSGAKVEKKYLRQWYIKTTAYAKSLYDGLSDVNPKYWRDIIDIQRDWIGKCTGTRLDFVLKNGDKTMKDPLTVHTDHPEAIYGVSHIAVSPEHRFNSPEYYKKHNTNSKTKDVLLSLYAIHPMTGKEIPVVVSADTKYPLNHDTHLGIPSISQCDEKVAVRFGFSFNQVFDSHGNVINSDQFTGMSKDQAFSAVCLFAKERGFGGHMVSARLKDWLISRQRYWGTPIPMIHCSKCQLVPVPVEELPVKLPRLECLSRKGLSPLSQAVEWLNVKCPKCGGDATRETDTMDTFVDSSWYFLRYLDPRNSQLPFEPDLANRLMPVDLYIGGKEHATLHLYFARFFNHFLCDAGYLKHREPFTNLLVQGMIMGQSYRVKETGQYLRPDQLDFADPKLPVQKDTGKELIVEWEKMSKSKYNGVDPQEIIDQFGVSSTRMTIVYNVAPKSDRKWSNTEFRGVVNWQSKLWEMVTMVFTKYQKVDHGIHNIEEWNQKIADARNIFLAEINFNFETTFMVSVAITLMQTLSDFLRNVPDEVAVNSEVYMQTLADIIVMISPISPAFASELWEGFRSIVTTSKSYNMSKPVQDQRWPCLDPQAAMILNVKCNSVGLYSVKIPFAMLNTLTKEQALKISQDHHIYKEHFEGQEVTKVVTQVKHDVKASIDYTIPSLDAIKLKKMMGKMKKSLDEL